MRTREQGQQTRRQYAGFELRREEYCEYKLEGEYCMAMQENCIYADARYCGHRLNFNKLKSHSERK